MLNNAQKSQLRKLANSLKPLGQIGKEGLSDNQLSFLDDALESHELIKIHLLKSCPITVNEVEIELIRQLQCEPVQVIGRTLILYRPSKENRKIRLVK